MKILLISLLLSTSAFAHKHLYKTRADQFATAAFTTQKTHPWPFALQSIGHNMQSYQDYSGSPYWHDGLDIRSLKDETIYAAAGGKVVNIENYIKGDNLYWEIAILDDAGFVWKCHHVNKNSITEEIKKAFASGSKISAGTILGTVVPWPSSSMGEVYHHLHLLVVAADKQYINPFLFLEPLPDTQTPIIHSIGLSQKHKPLKNKTSVKGAHGLYVEVSDLVLHQKYILPPHKISYRLDGQDEVIVWEFINLPSKTNDTDFISDFYLKGTCGDYRCREFYINLLFTPETPRLEKIFTPGEHEIEVMAEDIVGNKTLKAFRWTSR